MARNPFYLETLPVHVPLLDREEKFELLLERGQFDIRRMAVAAEMTKR